MGMMRLAQAHIGSLRGFGKGGRKSCFQLGCQAQGDAGFFSVAILNLNLFFIFVKLNC